MVAVFVAKAWGQLEGGRVPTRCGLGGTANNRRIVPEKADRAEIDKTGRCEGSGGDARLSFFAAFRFDEVSKASLAA